MTVQNTLLFNINQQFRVTVWFVVLLCALLLVLTDVQADHTYRVQKNDGLMALIEKYYGKSKLSHAQLMAGVLVKNPKAFRNGNINELLQGVRIEFPREYQIAAIKHRQASKLIARHNRAYKRGSKRHMRIPKSLRLAPKRIAKKSVQVKARAKADKLLKAESAPSDKVVSRNITTLSTLGDSRDLSQDLDILVDTLLSAEKQEKVKTDIEMQQSELVNLIQEKQALQKEIEDLQGELESTRKQKNKTLESDEKVAVSSSPKATNNDELMAEVSEENEVLKQQLLELRSELAENTRTTITLERQLAEYQSTGSESDKDEQSVGLLEKDNNKNIDSGTSKSAYGESPIVASPRSELTEAVGENTAYRENNNIDNNKRSNGYGVLGWFMLLLALLVGLWWLLKNLLTGGRDESFEQQDSTTYKQSEFSGQKKHTGEENSGVENSAVDEADRKDRADDVSNDQTDQAQKTEKHIPESGESVSQQRQHAYDPAYQEASLEASVKLDVARAYLEAGNNGKAYDVLQEVLEEGDADQYKTAREILYKAGLDGYRPA